MDDLRFFVEVARHGSFTAAGHALGCTRSHVSKRVARLEESMGLRLLQRTTRQVTTTPQGEELYQRARPLLLALDEVRADVVTQQTQLRGIVRVAAPLFYGLRRVAPVLHDFAARHPYIQVHVEYLDTKVDLVGGGFDLAIRGGELKDSTLVARRLSGIQVQLWGHPSYLQVYGVPGHPEDLVAHEIIHMRNERLYLWDGSARVLCNASVRIVSNNADARAKAAVRGLGLAVLPDFAARAELELVLPQWSLPGRRAFWLIQPPGRPARRAVKALADHLVEELT